MTPTTAPRFVPAVEQLGDRIVPSFVTKLASTFPSTVSPTREITGAVLSGNGRFLTFLTDARLVADDTNAHADVYLRDNSTGAVSLVSRADGPSGTVGNAESGDDGVFGVDLSADGRFVAFTSAASNLAPGDGNGTLDVFVRDTVTFTTRLVSRPSGSTTTSGNGLSYQPSISADGQVVAFASSASNLVGGDTNGALDVFVADLATNTVRLASAFPVPGGEQGDDDSLGPVLSGDGRSVVFVTFASNLTLTPGVAQVLLKDLRTDQLHIVSASTDGSLGNTHSGIGGVVGLFPGIPFRALDVNDDGRFVTFFSLASNLVPDDTNNQSDIFLRDMTTFVTTRVNTDASGNQSRAATNSLYRPPSISGNGRYIAFDSDAPDLVPGDTNGVDDVFVKDRITGRIVRASVGAANAQGDGESAGPTLSRDGSTVAYVSTSKTLIANDLNGAIDLFLTQLPLPSLIVSGAATGGGPTVNIHHPDGTVARTFQAYPAAYTGGVFVAAGDLTGDGVEEVVTSTGVGGSANIRVFDQQNVLLHSFFAYPPQFTGGVNVAVGDVNGDGVADIVCGVGVTGGPNVRILDGRAVASGNYSLGTVPQGGALLASFFAYPEAFTGGVRVAVADVNGDGFADVICGVGSSGGPNVRVLDGRQLSLGNFLLQPVAAGGALINSFFALPETFTGGVFVGTGDMNNDGTPDVVIGVESGGGPNVRAYDANSTQELGSFFAFDRTLTGGVRVATADVDLDGYDDYVTGTGPGTGSLFRVFSGRDRTTQLLGEFAPFGSFAGGVNVG